MGEEGCVDVCMRGGRRCESGKCGGEWCVHVGRKEVWRREMCVCGEEGVVEEGGVCTWRRELHKSVMVYLVMASVLILFTLMFP